MKAQFRSEEYCLEIERKTDLPLLLHAFAQMRSTGPNQLSFLESEYAVGDVMRFLADRRIPLLKLERAEPTVESLFMEVSTK